MIGIKILLIVGIIWIAHIPFIIPFYLAGREKREDQ